MKTEALRAEGSTAYDRYEALLEQLHELDLAGKRESDEADLLREQMAPLHDSFSDDQERRLRGLSADLFSFSSDEVHPPSQTSTTDAVRELPLAFGRQDWDRTLELLRIVHHDLPPARLAYVRGRCWDGLGRHAPALWFFDRAHALAPENSRFELLALNELHKLRRDAEAQERAERILKDPGAHPTLAFGAAKVLFDVAGSLTGADATPLYRQIVTALRSALDADAALPRPERLLALSSMARMNLAMALERLGRDADARMAYDQAVQESPGDDSPLMARALFLLSVSPADALRDLDELVRQGTALGYPYLFLAQQAFDQQAFDRCIELCQQAISRLGETALKAKVWELMAIAGERRGSKREVVREHFETAVGLDPLDDEITKNYEAFKSSAPGPLRADWDGALRLARSAARDAPMPAEASLSA